MGKTFARIHASSVGKFEKGDKIAQWIRYNGGQFSREVHDGVTHLISSPAAYKENAEAVKIAKELKTVKIVTFDWLEDSLLQKSKRPKSERPYLLEKMFGPKAKSKRGKAEPKKRKIRDPFLQRKSSRTSQTPQARERLYHDPETNEEWSIYLVRFTKPGGPREKFSLGLFETLRNPHSYSAFAKYSRTGTSNITILAPPRSKLEDAKTSIREFFTQKTGKEWKDRFETKATPAKKDSDGNVLPSNEGWYSVDFKGSSILGSYMMERAPVSISTDPPPASQQMELEDGNGHYVTANESPDRGTAVETNSLPSVDSFQMNQFDGSELFEH